MTPLVAQQVEARAGTITGASYSIDGGWTAQ
jgi:hypothetical protein